MEGLIQDIVNGLLLGGLYAIVAIGLSTIFGIVRLVNLAHGDLMILAAYLSLFMINYSSHVCNRICLAAIFAESGAGEGDGTAAPGGIRCIHHRTKFYVNGIYARRSQLDV